MTLTGKQRRHLRALGHNLDAVVHIGKEGLSEGALAATTQALLTHELVKVKLEQNADGDRHELAEELAVETDSELVQVLGRVVLLYRQHPDEPKIDLP
jgi:RNA-binding protein